MACILFHFETKEENFFQSTYRIISSLSELKFRRHRFSGAVELLFKETFEIFNRPTVSNFSCNDVNPLLFNFITL